VMHKCYLKDLRVGRLSTVLNCRHKGVTLIELMIVVTIVAILGAIAYPSYQSQVRKSYRADAQSDLMQLASFMERYFTENNAYVDSGGNAVTLPFTTSPQDGTARYNIAFSPSPTQTAFTLRATPVSGGTNDGDGILELDNLGVKGWDRDNSGSIASPGEKCWKKSC